MLLRPVRTIIMITIAFVAGMVYERSQMNDRCDAVGGTVVNGLCKD